MWSGTSVMNWRTEEVHSGGSGPKQRRKQRREETVHDLHYGQFLPISWSLQASQPWWGLTQRAHAPPVMTRSSFREPAMLGRTWLTVKSVWVRQNYFAGITCQILIDWGCGRQCRVCTLKLIQLKRKSWEQESRGKREEDTAGFAWNSRKVLCKEEQILGVLTQLLSKEMIGMSVDMSQLTLKTIWCLLFKTKY